MQLFFKKCLGKESLKGCLRSLTVGRYHVLIQILISKALTNSNISHDEFISVNNVFKKYDEVKEGIKNPSNK